MRNLFSPRFAALWAVAALLLILGAPAAFATAAEAPSESGWVEQESGTGGADDGSSEAEQGSSLGSGGSAPAPEPDPEPVVSSPPPTPEPTTPEPSAEEKSDATSSEEEEEAAAEEEVTPAPVVEEPEPPKPLAGGTAPVGSAVLGVSAEASLAPLVSSPTNFGDTEGSSAFGSAGVAFLAIVALLFAGVAGWFGLRRWRHSHRLRREAAEWKAAVRRLDPDPH
jgi:outer membrane biosynthesis protein TonB